MPKKGKKNDRKEDNIPSQDDRVLQAEIKSIEDDQEMADYNVGIRKEDKETRIDKSNPNEDSVIQTVEPTITREESYELTSNADEKSEDIDEADSSSNEGPISEEDIVMRTRRYSVIENYERKISAYLLVAFVFILIVVSICISMIPYHLRMMMFVILTSASSIGLLYLRSYFIDKKTI